MQAEEAIEILLKLGFIKRNDNGKLEQVSLNISTGPEVKSIHVFNYHNNMLGLTSYAMNKTESQFRDISSMSFAINKTEFQYLKKRIAEFRKEILQYLADRKKGIFPEENAGLESVLYNLNIHLFNSTKIKWKK
jgi:uncharacterized protein (TIGR02147 family)